MDKERRIAESIIESYSYGISVNELASDWSKDENDVLMILREYKKTCTFGRKFTKEFKLMIAQRDITKSVTRTSISEELDINPNTVKKACEEYGNSLKEKAQSGQETTRIEGLFSFKECPSCKSKKVNKVDEHTQFCMDCGDEHIFNFEEEYILKVNFEWIE